MKAPTEKFPFNYDVPRRSRKILRSNTDDGRAKDVRVEVGRTSSRSPTPEAPASDVMKIRVYKRDGNATQIRRKGIKSEEIRLRKGDVVVRGTTPGRKLRRHRISNQLRSGGTTQIRNGSRVPFGTVVLDWVGEKSIAGYMSCGAIPC